MKKSKSYNLYVLHIIPILLVAVVLAGLANYKNLSLGTVLSEQGRGKSEDKGKEAKAVGKPDKQSNSNKGTKSQKAEEHRKNIKNVVEDLGDVAETEDFVGNTEVSDDIEEVADAEEEEVDEVTEAIEAVESRGKWQTLLIGSDYKNLGKLRSALAHNTNSIRKLTRAGGEVVAEGSEETVSTSLAALYEERARIQGVIEENENEFSLLGWVFRFLSGYDPSLKIVDVSESSESTESTETPGI